MVKITQDFLQRHTVNLRKPRGFLTFLQVGEQPTRLDVGQRIAVHLPFVAPDSQEVVEHEADTTKCTVDEDFLRLTRIDAELIAERVRFHALTSFAMFSGSRYTA